MCHVRCTSDDCPHARSVLIILVYMMAMYMYVDVHIACSDASGIVIDLHESKTHAIADTDCSWNSLQMVSTAIITSSMEIRPVTRSLKKGVTLKRFTCGCKLQYFN